MVFCICDNKMVRVAMVCLGNICRSPMAEAVAKEMAKEAGVANQVVIESFGTAGWHEGGRTDPAADAALRRRGWPVGDHRARRIHPCDLEAADLVLCADRSNLEEVRRLAMGKIDANKIQLLRSYDPAARPGDDDIPDPWGCDAAQFDRSLQLIEAACRGLIGALVRRSV